MAIVLVTGSGTTRLGEGTRLTNYPYVLIGGEIATRTISTATGDVTYYGLDNSLETVYRLRCYQDISVTPEYDDYEKYCNGALVHERKITQFTSTLTVTDDTIDLEQLRILARQSSADFWSVGAPHNIETLIFGELVSGWTVPVLFEQHYKHPSSTDDQWVALLAFEATLSIGEIPIDPTEGWTTELTINIDRSDTYDGYLALMRHDTVQII